MAAQSQVQHERASQSPAVPAARAGALAPLVTQAWADAIARYWESLLAQDALDLRAPLCVLDGGAAHGDLAWAMPAALAARLADSPCAGLRVHYLACDGRPPLLDAACSVNPVVYIGWHMAAAWPAAAHCVEYGNIFSAAGDGRWHPFSPETDVRGQLLAYYVAQCPSVVLSLPLHACALLDGVSGLARGRYLAIGAEFGASTLQQVRAQVGGVNVHALLLTRQWQGAATWSGQRYDDGVCVYLASDNAQAAAAAARALDAAHPDDAAELPSMAHGATPRQALALLHRSACDSAVLRACADSLLTHRRLDRAWQAVLERTWFNYRLPDSADPFYRQCAELAARAGHWGLAKECLRTGLAHFGDNGAARRQLAACERATGGMAAARSLDGAALGKGRQQGPHDGELTLEALHTDHVEAMRYQLREPSIAGMCCLPAFADDTEAARWIRAQRRDRSKRSYAVMHACWGLVGVLGWQRHGDAACFYFWTGSDFQGRGYGPRAAQLAFAHALQDGVQTLFASVFADNARSLRALGLLGFAPLDLQASDPHEELLFVHKALAVTGGDAIARLLALCDAICSPFEFTQKQEVCMTTAQP